MLALSASLALGACAAPGTTPAGDSSGSATPGASGSATEDTTGKDGTMEPLGENATDTELIDQLEGSLTSFTEHLGGDWTFQNQKRFVAQGDYLEYPAVPCSSDGTYEDDSAGQHFSLTLLGPGVPEPEARLGQAREWAAANGWEESGSGQGVQPDQGGVFVTFTGEGRPLISLNVSTAKSLITSKTPCSTDNSVTTHDMERPKWTSPGNRFESEGSTPTPSPSSTRLGISG